MFEKVEKIIMPTISDSLKGREGDIRNYLINLTSDDFENFVFEWLKFVKFSKDETLEIFKIGSSGDKGTDILCCSDGKYYLYQCKHYTAPITLPKFCDILIKILLYFYLDYKDKYPELVFAILLNGTNNKAAEVYLNKNELKNHCLDRVSDCIDEEEIKIDASEISKFCDYLENFDFKKYKILNVLTIADEYFNSDVSYFRFNKSVPTRIPHMAIPEERIEEKVFYKQIISCLDESHLCDDDKRDYLNIAISDYYLAKSLKYTCEHFLGSDEEFNVLKNDIFTYMKTSKFIAYDSSFSRLQNILNGSMSVSTTDSFLDYGLHMVSTQDKKGVCHFIVDNGEFSWNGK